MKYIPIILGLVLSLSCARTKVVKEVVVEEDKDGARISIFEPYRLDIKIESSGTLIKEPIFSVQIGAFTEKRYAMELKEKASKQLKEDVRLEYTAPYYKVRVGDSLMIEEAMKLKVRVQKMGWTNAFISRFEPCEVDTMEIPIEKVIKEKGRFSVQVGAFVRKKWAEEMVKELSAKIKKIPLIRKELPYYKVVITGFTDRKEAEEMRDRLNMEFGYFEVFILEE